MREPEERTVEIAGVDQEASLPDRVDDDVLQPAAFVESVLPRHCATIADAGRTCLALSVPNLCHPSGTQMRRSDPHLDGWRGPS
jgi:hypothetical protein